MTGFNRVLGATGLAGVDRDGNPVGDLTGSYPGPIVKGLQTYPIDPRTQLLESSSCLLLCRRTHRTSLIS